MFRENYNAVIRLQSHGLSVHLCLCIQVTKASDSVESAATVITDSENQVDGNVVLKSKKVSKSISKKKSRKRAKAIVEAEEHINKDESAVDVNTGVKDELCMESSHVTSDVLPKPSAELTLSDNEEPPEDFTFDDSRQQIMMEEEHVKQHVAKCVYIIIIHTHDSMYGKYNACGHMNRDSLLRDTSNAYKLNSGFILQCL